MSDFAPLEDYSEDDEFVEVDESTRQGAEAIHPGYAVFLPVGQAEETDPRGMRVPHSVAAFFTDEHGERTPMGRVPFPPPQSWLLAAYWHTDRRRREYGPAEGMRALLDSRWERETRRLRWPGLDGFHGDLDSNTLLPFMGQEVNVRFVIYDPEKQEAYYVTEEVIKSEDDSYA